MLVSYARGIRSDAFSLAQPRSLRPPALHYTQFPSHLTECLERELELLGCVRRGHNRSHARPIARDGRKCDALHEHTFLKEPVRQLHRERAVADNHRRDRALAEARIEPQTV